MSIKKSFMLALSNIMYDKMRSFLTMLGIIIGVGAVIILISLMDGMANMMQDQFSQMGINAITISTTNRGGNRTINEDEFYKIRDDNPNLFAEFSPVVSLRQATVKSGSVSSTTTTVTGVSEEYYDLKRLELASGRFIQYYEVENKKKVCVIGTYIQREYFGMESALNKTIKINGDSYLIVGILSETDSSKSGSGDDIIYIPYTVALRFSESAHPSSYTINAKNEESISIAMDTLEEMLEKKLGDSDYFRVSNLQELVDKATEMVNKMKLLLVCIAAISLLVGGIGIMNIMLVSVTERTREIGIRKSLGAKGRDILSQFIIEAGTVSGVGGILGIIIGGILSVLIGKLLDLTTYPSISAVLISFSVSVTIGILFGYLPAKNAAKLNPIEALRHD